MFGQTSPGISSEIHLALIAFHLQKKVQRGRKVARMRKAVRIHTSPHYERLMILGVLRRGVHGRAVRRRAGMAMPWTKRESMNV
jgi:hypothetical protein